MGNGQRAISWHEPHAPGKTAGGRNLKARLRALTAPFIRSAPQATLAAANTALIYLLLSVFWVIFSDRLLLLLIGTSDAQRITRMQTFKGWAFVLISSLFLFALVRRFAASIERAQREAEASNRIKDQFLAVLSHELRTPLTPALLNASALRSDPRLPEDARETAAEVADQITTEARIIDDLLDISGIVSGAIRIDRNPVDMHALVHEALDTARRPMLAKTITLNVQLDAEQCVVSGDRNRLLQAINAVIANAVKFTPSGGRITVRSRVEGGQWCIEVIDSGIGIPSDLLPRLFHPFEQGDRTMTRQFGGLGLGLSLSRHLLDLHGGSITAASEGPDRGACFTICLPLMPPAAERQPRDGAIPAHKPTGLRILLVEDDKETRTALAALLRGMGHTVTSAGTAIDAQRLIHNNGRVDVLIADIHLPDGDGRELLHPARLRHGTMGIAVSGFGATEDVAQSLAAGFNTHLVKPFTPEQVRQAIQHCAQLMQRA